MTDSHGTTMRRVFDRLFQTFGPQHWWPADTPFEVIVGAILTQNAAWRNVKKCIENLKTAGFLDLKAMCDAAAEDLAALIRPSVYYNRKALKLKTFCEHLGTRWGGDLDLFLAQKMDDLRPELLGISGIGRETADSIILYAACRPSFVVDTYTHRILSRHGWAEEDWDYDGLRDYFMNHLEPDVPFYQEFHALLDRTGHLFCRRKPLCDSCPLNGWQET
jgi:endonuclease III related protein